MKLSQKVYIKLNRQQKKVIDELIWHVTKLYNISNFDMREKKYVPYTQNDKLLKSNWHSDRLHAHNRQQLLRKLDEDWKSYFKAIKDYQKNPKKYTGRPNKPGFKNINNKPGEVIFTKAGITQSHTKGNNPKGNLLILSLSKKMKAKYQMKNIKLKLTEKVLKLIGELKNINQVTIKKDYFRREYYLNIVYIKDEKETEDYTNIMSIDLGLDNLATITFLENEETYIIDGKKLKSRRKYFDKELSYYQSIRMKQTSSKKFKDTKNIKKLRKKNRDYQLNYLHHAANQIIEYAKKHKVRTIVVGDMKNIKNGMKNNKSFVKSPIQKIKKLIEYKGLLVNADVNGSLNILRKYLKLKCIPKLITLATDNGVVNAPKRISVACC